MSLPKAGDRRYRDSGWGSIACHSFVIWVTGIDQEWRTGRRLGIGHRQRAGKEQGHIEPWGGLVPRFVLCAQGDLKREG